MTRHSPSPPPSSESVPDVVWFADRAAHYSHMSLNALMNNCGVLTDTELNDWLHGANIICHPDDFGGFEVIYGFDRHAQDFVVVKNKTPGGPHFALIADQGATS
jgi:hypothetical protein